MTLTVIGIDANSKKIALVWTVHGKPMMKTMALSAGDSPKSAGLAFRQMCIFFGELQDIEMSDVHVYMEQAVIGKFQGTTIPQAYVEGAIMAACYEYRISCKLVNNLQWKKQILGNGRLDKPGIQVEMQRVWPQLMKRIPTCNAKQWKDGPNGMPDQDLVDAGAIYLFGQKNMQLRRRIIKRREAPGK